MFLQIPLGPFKRVDASLTEVISSKLFCRIKVLTSFVYLILGASYLKFYRRSVSSSCYLRRSVTQTKKLLYHP